MLVPVLLNEHLALGPLSCSWASEYKQHRWLVGFNDGLDPKLSKSFLDALVDLFDRARGVDSDDLFLGDSESFFDEWHCHLLECLKPLHDDLGGVVQPSRYLASANQSLFHDLLVAFQVQI